MGFSSAYGCDIIEKNKTAEQRTSNEEEHDDERMEKIFCQVIGLFDWETFVNIKKFVHLYDRVLNWDDSAGEDAFRNAKDRFYSLLTLFVRQNDRFPNPDEIMQGLHHHHHHHPCDVNSWPDKYIDEVDWDLEVDSELAKDFDWVSQVDDDDDYYSAPDTNVVVKSTEPVVIFGEEFYKERGFSIGWGDEFEEDTKEHGNPNLNYNNNPWEQSLTNIIADGGHIAAAGMPASRENIRAGTRRRGNHQNRSRNRRADDSRAFGTCKAFNKGNIATRRGRVTSSNNNSKGRPPWK